jgi:hypothetical protein
MHGSCLKTAIRLARDIAKASGQPRHIIVRCFLGDKVKFSVSASLPVYPERNLLCTVYPKA